MKNITKLHKKDLRLSMFAPIERETPIIEVLFGEQILLDLSFRKDNPDKEVEVLFYDDITGVSLSEADLLDLIKEGKERLAEN